MDFMRVFDQTVREIKREVNLRVLKVPEIEQKVLDATSDEPWGPHGSALAEIAQETKKIAERQMIMNVLWKRLSESGSNWRHVYKALSVIEYLLANGSDRTVDDIIEHSFQISSLSGFQYMEPNGKDIGINVRKKAETLLALLNDSGRITRVREKAAATRNKYFGVSSSGITYKSGSALISSSSFGGGYGVFGGGSKDDGYKDRDYLDGQTRSKCIDSFGGSNYASYNQVNKSKKGIALRCSSSKPSFTSYHVSTSAQKNDEDNLDDFDPRAGSAPVSVSQVNQFGDSLVGDPLDAPTSVPLEMTLSTYGCTTEIDLFADPTNFISGAQQVDGAVSVGSNSHLQDNYVGDLFGSQSANKPASFPSQMDLFDATFLSKPSSQMTHTNSTDLFAAKPPIILTNSVNFDPFASKCCHQSDAINGNGFDPFASELPQPEMTNVDNFDPFATNSPHSGITDSHQFDMTNADSFYPFAIVPLNASKEPDLFGTLSTTNARSINSESSANSGDQNQHTISKQQTKDNFQIKSGIWADSLSCGLIDLNITTPVESTLADIGIVSGLGGDTSNYKEKGLPSSSLHMRRAMGTGTGLGISSLPSMGGAGRSFSNFGSFK